MFSFFLSSFYPALQAQKITAEEGLHDSLSALLRLTGERGGCESERDTERERETERQRYRERERESERDTEREIYRERGRGRITEREEILH